MALLKCYECSRTHVLIARPPLNLAVSEQGSMKKRLLVTVVLWSGVVGLAVGQETSVCLMSPRYLTIQVPVQGVTWLEGELFDGPCNAIADSGWVRQPADSFDLLVAADGPRGSGRYWTVAVGIAEPGETAPRRGFCLVTTTVGWRTLQRFSTFPLPWLGDRDSDGRPEVIIWDSYPLRENATPAEYGLIAWVYQVNPEGVLTVDWRLSREIAEEIASEYRSPVEGAGARFQEMRNDVARYLEAFASEKCTMREQGSR